MFHLSSGYRRNDLWKTDEFHIKMISLSSIRIKLNYDYYSQFSGQKKSNIKFLPTTATYFFPSFFYSSFPSFFYSSKLLF